MGHCSCTGKVTPHEPIHVVHVWIVATDHSHHDDSDDVLHDTSEVARHLPQTICQSYFTHQQVPDPHVRVRVRSHPTGNYGSWCVEAWSDGFVAQHSV